MTMCASCDECFSKEEKKRLEELGWNAKQIDFAENSIIEDKIRELIK